MAAKLFDPRLGTGFSEVSIHFAIIRVWDASVSTHLGAIQNDSRVFKTMKGVLKPSMSLRINFYWCCCLISKARFLKTFFASLRQIFANLLRLDKGTSENEVCAKPCSCMIRNRVALGCYMNAVQRLDYDIVLRKSLITRKRGPRMSDSTWKTWGCQQVTLM